MIWAATMGLLLSLEGVGAVLGLEKQKLSEGKRPHQILPASPGSYENQWAAYKESLPFTLRTSGPCSRNIISVMWRPKWASSRGLQSFRYQLRSGMNTMDQEINDRGVRLDMELVANAIEMDTRSRTELTETMKEITELENPNSVQQMKAWLSDNGLETDTLGKKAVTELLKSASPKLSQVPHLKGDSWPSPLSVSIRRLKRLFAQMVVPVACSILRSQSNRKILRS